MMNLKTPFVTKSWILAQFASFAMLLLLSGCAGVSSSSKSSTPPPPTGPTITSLSPNSGAVGAPVIITGSNFGSTAAAVTFNGKTASVSTWSDSQIATKVPSGATSGNVVVTVNGVASNLVGFTVVTSTSVPTISSVTPSSGAIGAAVTITGTNFGSTSGTVTFNGTSASLISWTDSSIETTVPSGATSGNVVVTANGGPSNGVNFTVVAAASAPEITGISPPSGAVGQAVSITGTNFGSATGTVTFNGTKAQITTWTDTSIATTVPSGATSGLVVVIAGSTGSNGVDFIVNGPPSPNIAALYPTSGVVGALVTIEGSNFGSSAGSVIFDGTPAPILKWTASKITTKVPAGATSGNVVVAVGSNVSNGIDFTVGPPTLGPITAAYFGFQCGSGVVTGANNCTNTPGTKNPTWPTSLAQPGLLRLWDSQVSWSYLMTGYSGGVGTYSWGQLDGYLDMLAAHQPVQANYVFGCVPAFIASGATGSTPGSCGLNGSASPPADLTVDGSPIFNQFVADLVNHCSPAGNCVKDLVNGYELWNEANVSTGLAIRWTGTQLQLYQMVAPAVAIINSRVPNARILTPSIVSGPAGSLPAKWMQSWLNIEVQNGIISNYINIHQYMNNNAPEDISSIWSGSVGPNKATSGWTPVPWIMGETSWDDIVLPYGCNDGNTGTLFSTQDCIGQMARWNLILMSNGSSGVFWYYWNTNIGQYSNYSTAFYYMMQYLQGGTFGGPCSANAQGVWTCSFTKIDGTSALWVWVPNESGAPFTVPAGYTDYMDLSGAKTSVTAGSTIGVTVTPIMLEK